MQQNIMIKDDRKKQSLQDFFMLSIFAIGSYAKVALVRKKNDGKIYAMKMVRKQGRVKGIMRAHAYIQKDILQKINHPFIIPLHSTFQNSRKLYFILEFCPGGQLFGMIRRKGRISEEICRFYAAQIFLALEYLHSRKIIYRDLKPENVLFDRKGYIRLIDFGLSKFSNSEVQNHMTKRDIAGTLHYLPPEAFDPKVEISYTADWWAFGTLIYEMTMGFPPFFANGTKTSHTIKKIKYEKAPLDGINSQPLKNFLSLLLEKDPSKRLGRNGSKQLRKHPWMIGIPWERILRKEETPFFIPSLSSDSDLTFYQEDHGQLQFTPPSEEQSNGQIYQSFSLSWRSRKDRSPSNVETNNEDIQIQLSINDLEQLLPSYLKQKSEETTK